jgi:choline dehydrogenase-like flavoprotein
MSHLRSNIFVRIRRRALARFGLAEILDKSRSEVAAFVVRGSAYGRRFHYMVVAAARKDNPEAAIWSMIPDTDLISSLLGSQDPDWISIALRGIGEMEGNRQLKLDSEMSWVGLSEKVDREGIRRAFVHLVPTQNDRRLWDEMDSTAVQLARKLAGNDDDVEFLVSGEWKSRPDLSNHKVFDSWRDDIGSSHHEGGTLFMGDTGRSITNCDGRFHSVDNLYATGSALFPTIGSANPVLTGLALARKTADSIVRNHRNNDDRATVSIDEFRIGKS